MQTGSRYKHVMSTTANSLFLTKRLLHSRRLFCCLLLAGPLLGGSAVSRLLADDRDRTGADAPHQERNVPANEDNFHLSGGAQERNSSANEDKFRLSGSQSSFVSITQTSEGGTDIRIRKLAAGTAPSKTARTQKAKTSTAKAAAQAKAETKQAPAATPSKPVPASYFDNQRIGQDAPHQERNSDPSARGARLLIWERE